MAEKAVHGRPFLHVANHVFWRSCAGIERVKDAVAVHDVDRGIRVEAVELDAVAVALQQAQHVGADRLDVHVGNRVVERPSGRNASTRRLRRGLAIDRDGLQLRAERERIHRSDPPANKKAGYSLRSRGLPARIRRKLTYEGILYLILLAVNGNGVAFYRYL